MIFSIPDHKGIQKLKIDFQEVKYGLLSFNLTLGKKNFETRFSEVFDPIIGFKKWLEAISIGVEQCSFSFDTEGLEVRFGFEQISNDREIFYAAEAYDNSEVFLCDYVDRFQVVDALYNGLLDFRNSSDFVAEEWEDELMHEKLSKEFNYGYKTLAVDFVDLSRDELKKILFKAYLIYKNLHPGVTREEALSLLIDEAVNNEISTEHQRIEIPPKWSIPEDYDSWTRDKREDFVTNCLNQRISPYNGTKIRYFRSYIIEDYLKVS
ncbi:MAG: hypothetical protein ACR2MD_04080 [Aridibacter sp.]